MSVLWKWCFPHLMFPFLQLEVVSQPRPFSYRARRAKKGLVKWSVPIGEHLPRKSRHANHRLLTPPFVVNVETLSRAFHLFNTLLVNMNPYNMVSPISTDHLTRPFFSRPNVKEKKRSGQRD